MKPYYCAFFASLLLSFVAAGQTTQGTLRVKVVALADGQGLSGSLLKLWNEDTQAASLSRSDHAGEHVFANLPPGRYTLRAELQDFQAQEVHSLELRVAGSLFVMMPMRRLEQVWEDDYRRSLIFPNSSVLVIYGPDVETGRTGQFQADRAVPGALEATVSQVITNRVLSEIPLAGRDAYTLLVTQPGVTADSATFRSLGISVNGQRPTASNFLLDGLENNDEVVTGPLSPLPPELLQEYRLTTNNFTPEYGRTSGFLANAITRRGSADYHGLAWFNVMNEGFNSNGYANNAAGNPRPKYREFQGGGVLAGRLPHSQLLFSLAAERYVVHTESPSQLFEVPTADFISSLREGSIARDLLSRFSIDRQNIQSGSIVIRPPVTITRRILLPRVDWTSKDHNHRFLVRYADFHLSRPDLIYSPYSDFRVPLKRNSGSLAVAYEKNFEIVWQTETRFGLNSDIFSAERPHPEIPTLVILGNDSSPLTLPGAPTGYSYRNQNRSFQLNENVTRVIGRHIWKGGAGASRRQVDGLLSIYQSRQLLFNDLSAFTNDAPSILTSAEPRKTELQSDLDSTRAYRIGSAYAFLQDSIRVGRASLSAGIRLDRFGVPVNVGSIPDLILRLPAGGPVRGLMNASFSLGERGAPVYSGDSLNWAPRIGLSWSLDASARTVLRASAGRYFDRVFDNFWQTLRNNSVDQVTAQLPGRAFNYLNPSETLAAAEGRFVETDAPEVTLLADHLHSPRSDSAFVGVQRSLARRSYVEVNGLFSRAADLLTTDRWNREFSLPVRSSDNRLARLNGQLPNVLYRAGQGRSDYIALTALARHTTNHIVAQISYTLSRTRDIQSDPIAGEFFELGYSGAPLTAKALFSRQFDPNGDWGSSDFDQRHNFVAFGTFEMPRKLRGWRVATLAAIRSGFPYTVVGPFLATNDLRRVPADVVAPGSVFTNEPVSNGVRLLNASAFAAVSDRLGNSGRNSFHGPGVYNLDLSLARSIGIRLGRESAKLTIRTDAYNVLNHANLNNPVSVLGQPDFGIAYRGRSLRPNAFRITGPLAESGRQLQLLLRVEF